MEGPVLLTRRWSATRQGGEPGFLFAIQFAMPVLPCGPVLEGGLDSFGGSTLAQPFNRGLADLDRLGDLGICPLRSLRTRIRLQQDASARRGAG